MLELPSKSLGLAAPDCGFALRFIPPMVTIPVVLWFEFDGF